MLLICSDPGFVRVRFKKTRSVAQENCFLCLLRQLVDSTLRLVLRRRLHQQQERAEIRRCSRSGCGLGSEQIQVRAWVLHRREGEAATKEDRREFVLPRFNVPLGDRVTSRHRCIGLAREVIGPDPKRFAFLAICLGFANLSIWNLLRELNFCGISFLNF